MGRAIAFDNSVLSPLIKSALDPSKLSDRDKVNAKRARFLVDEIQAANLGLDKEKQTKINLPMPVIAECLAGWSVEEQAATLLRLKKIGAPLVYDEASALISGRMWAELKAKGLVPKGHSNARDCVKADTMIAACCKAHGVATIYSEDNDFDAFKQLDACKGLSVERLPQQVGTKALFNEAVGGNEAQGRDGK